MNELQIIKRLIKQFGENTPVRTIAKYAEDEYMIPYKKAVALIYDAA